MLELKDIYYKPATSRRDILNGLYLSASLGNPIVISGSSGSGKTSLVEVISGLSGQSKGEICWNGEAINQRQRRWLSGVVFQFPERYFLGLTVAQELRLGQRRLTTERQSIALKKVGLSDLDLSKSPERLSGGQQRRLALAVQLLRKPRVLLLDEPTAGLDWSVREEVIDLLTSISKEQILIIVTHEPELFRNIRSLCYKLINGKIQRITKESTERETT